MKGYEHRIGNMSEGKINTLVHIDSAPLIISFTPRSESLLGPHKSALCLHSRDSGHWSSPAPSRCCLLASLGISGAIPLPHREAFSLCVALSERCFALTVGPLTFGFIFNLVFPTSLDSTIQPQSQEYLNTQTWLEPAWP